MAPQAPSVELIRDELVCPSCEYSLRGLQGDLIRCPECGIGIDIARLVASQWRGKWYLAPGFQRALLPVAWTAIVTVLCVIFPWRDAFFGWWFYALALFLGWPPASMPSIRVNGVRLTLALGVLGHVVLFCIFTSIIIGLYAARVALIGLLGGAFLVGVLALAALLVAVALFILGRWLERFMARCCIRRHLRERAAIFASQSEVIAPPPTAPPTSPQ